VNFDNTVPIYIQIMNLIKKDIILGKIELGESCFQPESMPKA
jgi:DNA-binding transcriptional regulator YhcF (GntR family)